MKKYKQYEQTYGNVVIPQKKAVQDLESAYMTCDYDKLSKILTSKSVKITTKQLTKIFEDVCFNYSYNSDNNRVKKTLKLLLQHGADSRGPNKDCKAFLICLLNRQHACIQVLTEYSIIYSLIEEYINQKVKTLTSYNHRYFTYVPEYKTVLTLDFAQAFISFINNSVPNLTDVNEETLALFKIVCLST